MISFQNKVFVYFLTQIWKLICYYWWLYLFICFAKKNIYFVVLYNIFRILVNYSFNDPVETIFLKFMFRWTAVFIENIKIYLQYTRMKPAVAWLCVPLYFCYWELSIFFLSFYYILYNYKNNIYWFAIRFFLISRSKKERFEQW